MRTITIDRRDRWSGSTGRTALDGIFDVHKLPRVVLHERHGQIGVGRLHRLLFPLTPGARRPQRLPRLPANDPPDLRTDMAHNDRSPVQHSAPCCYSLRLCWLRPLSCRFLYSAEQGCSEQKAATWAYRWPGLGGIPARWSAWIRPPRAAQRDRGVIHHSAVLRRRAGRRASTRPAAVPRHHGPGRRAVCRSRNR